MKNILFIAFSIITCYLTGQEKTPETSFKIDSNNSETIDSSEWQPGYIVMRLSGDTISGLVRKKQGRFKNTRYHIKWVDFKVSTNGTKNQYMSDSIIAFRSGDNIWRYFNYCRWSEQIIEGKINVFKAFVETNRGPATTGGVNFIPCLAFKKGNEKAKFITLSETKMFSSVLTKKSKEKFKEYIADNPKILAEFEQETFIYEDLEALMLKYNSMAKKELSK